MRHYSLIAVVLAGFAAGIGQVLILRELLILFYGNELSTGLVLAAWLLWTAVGSSIGGKISQRFPAERATQCLGLLLLALLIPLTLLWIRSAHLVWSIPLGELTAPGLMLAVSLSASCAFCLISGFMFAWCWHSYVSTSMLEPNAPRPIMIYLGEALGTAGGGLFFYFVLLPYASNLKAACLTSLTLLGMVFLLIRPWRDSWRSRPVILIIGMAMSALVVSIAVKSSRLDDISHRWQWGPGLVAVRDTPYNNLALVEDTNQYSLFGTGLWFFSLPDSKTSEFSVHLALLQHPQPQKVLLVGGGSVELVREILKHPSLNGLDVVEPDPGIINLLQQHVPAQFISPIRNQKVDLHYEDAVSFIQHSHDRYDVILLNVGDPMNAELNRFYTLEFFQKLSRRINPGGLLSFAVSASDYLGPVQVRFLRSFYDTVRAVFPEVIVYLVDSARFFASNQKGVLLTDPQELVTRIKERGLRLQYVRDYYIFDYLNPMRLNYLNSVLRQSPPRGLNKDFSPTCYFNNLLLWASQLHPGLEKFLIGLSNVKQKWFWIGLATVLVGFIMFSWSGLLSFAATCKISVMIMGAAQLILEILLLLSFQIMQGFVYKQLALIVTLFMAGVGLGAAIQSFLESKIGSAKRWFAAVQLTFGLYVLVALKILFVMHESSNNWFEIVPASAIFALLAAVSGILGGLHFALALRTFSGIDAVAAAVAGRLYAIDLIGASVGALAVSLYMVPVYGVVTTMIALCVTSAGAAFALLKV